MRSQNDEHERHVTSDPSARKRRRRLVWIDFFAGVATGMLSAYLALGLLVTATGSHSLPPGDGLIFERVLLLAMTITFTIWYRRRRRRPGTDGRQPG